MSKIDYQKLREIAEKTKIAGEAPVMPFDQRINALNDFMKHFSPATVLALLDELERNQQYIKRRDQENEDIALTVGKLRVELEGKDSKIANLTAERDALREGEMGDARYSNTRAAADIYFQLVEECEIPAGGSLVEYVDDMREKLEAAEKRIAELESGSQAQKLVEAIIVAIENEQERLFDEDYLMDSKECIDVIREEVKRWNDSRAAMLHGAEPVSQTYKSQHTQFEQVADLYEMQFDDGRTCAFHTDAQKAAQWLQACDGNRVQEYVKLERLRNALSGNYPVTPDGWISCSERMPEIRQTVIGWNGYAVRQCVYTRNEYAKTQKGREPRFETLTGIWHGVTHWMPLPEPPQEVNRG
ncbi:ead/Ea22-like family protein [Escherichia coli]|nr:ead/Ea22-like family protein [Escherichia coli]